MYQSHWFKIKFTVADKCVCVSYLWLLCLRLKGSLINYHYYCYFLWLVLHSQGLKISKYGNVCPEWLRWGLGNGERVGKAHCIVITTITIVIINIVTVMTEHQLLCCVMLLEVSSAKVTAGDARG